MSHLDEGQIAELIDGRLAGPAAAHADTCAECRDRVADARRIQERARAILRSGVPTEAPPPFADVLARAGKTPRRRMPWRTLAWAATVTLAASIGWYGRTLVRTEPPEAGSEVVAAVPLIAPPEADRTAPVAAPPATPAPSLPSTPAEPPRVVASGVVGPPPPPAGARDLMDRNQAQSEGAGAPTGRTALRPAAPERAEAETMLAADEAVLEGWRIVSLDEAVQLLGGNIQRVEGLATLGYAVRAAPGGVEVRTEQRLESGAVLELLQRRADAAAAATPLNLARTRTDSFAQARERRAVEASDAVRRGGFLITARAPVSLDSLRALLLRLQ